MQKLDIMMPMLQIMSQHVLEWGYTAWQQSRDATWVAWTHYRVALVH